MWEKVWGGKCCPGPESCLPRARPVLGASVSEWHKGREMGVTGHRGRVACTYAKLQEGW